MEDVALRNLLLLMASVTVIRFIEEAGVGKIHPGNVYASIAQNVFILILFVTMCHPRNKNSIHFLIVTLGGVSANPTYTDATFRSLTLKLFQIFDLREWFIIFVTL